ncbi:MAG: UDP-N-acetylmuramoyl-tripeptide--D-alanyl-D-alanine ligase [Fimbriimonadales bacterium]|nr:MAG: UDP-N-acetylmuramoyl-tripeptide--D-alanyl-D-alanine ligase [Fimbriimonadales bacterium]
MRITPDQLSEILGVPVPSACKPFERIQVDSRKVKDGDLFCAVRGARVDGHDYVPEAARQGASACLVERATGAPNEVQVANVVEALASIARWIRGQFEGTVIGVTGSFGKTSTKEYIAAALGAFGEVLKSEGNQNTEFGLPMTWMRAEPYHKFAVLEMAMRGLGQIRHLCSFSQPHHGVLTGIGTAHIGELGSLEAIADAKLELFDSLPADGVAVAPADTPFPDKVRRTVRGRLVTFGSSAEADVSVRVVELDPGANRTRVEIRLDTRRFETWIPGLGEGFGRNASAAVAVCHALGLDVERALEGLSESSLPPDRLRYLRHGDHALLVDVYNSSPESCIEALRLLKALPAKRRIAILGEMRELGSFAEEYHRMVGAVVADLALDWLAVVGRESLWIRDEAIARGFGGRIDSFTHSDDAGRVLRRMGPGDVALIKGSRALEMERALEAAGVPHAV